jgi:cell division septum initiation protein DivIVA
VGANMALFNNKEMESLQAENTELKNKITTLEVRLSAKEKALSECKQTIDRLTAEVEECRTELSNSLLLNRAILTFTPLFIEKADGVYTIGFWETIKCLL